MEQVQDPHGLGEVDPLRLPECPLTVHQADHRPVVASVAEVQVLGTETGTQLVSVRTEDRHV